MDGQALEARNLPDQLADQLALMIATGELKPGQRIFEKRICELKGVSRIPVREALRLLQAQGVVRTEPNRGTYVTAFTADEMHEMFELRLAVERIALRRISRGESDARGDLEADRPRRAGFSDERARGRVDFVVPVDRRTRGAVGGPRVRFECGDSRAHRASHFLGSPPAAAATRAGDERSRSLVAV